MSAEALEWAIAQDVDLSARMVLVKVAQLADGWTARTTGAALARAMHAPTRTVQCHIKQLEAAGLVDASVRGTITLQTQPVALHETQPAALGASEAQPVAFQTAETQPVAFQPEPETPPQLVLSGSPESLNNPYSPPNSPLTPPAAPNRRRARTREAPLPLPRWAEILNAFKPVNAIGKSHKTRPLTAEHLATVQRKYGHLDLEDQALRFTDHYTTNPQPKWAGYSRWMSWLEIAEEKRKRGHIPTVNGQRSNGVPARVTGQTSVYAPDGSEAGTIAARFATGDPEWARRNGYRVVHHEPRDMDSVGRTGQAGQENRISRPAQPQAAFRLQAGVG